MEKQAIVTIRGSLPFPPFESNAYLFRTEAGGFLFDTSLKSDAAAEQLAAAVESFGGIDGIILSHGHLDHAGAAASLAARFDVPVYVSLGEADRISGDFNDRVERRLRKILAILEHFGFDTETTQREIDKIAYYRDLMDPIDFFFNIRSLDGDDVAVIDLPGHTAGCAGIFLKKSGVLLSGDAFLQEGVSPFFDPEALTDSLALYMRSLDVVAELAPAVVYPGHGAPFDNCTGHIAGHRDYVRTMQDKINDALTSGVSLAGIYKNLFPSKYNILIALAEIIAALEKKDVPVLKSLGAILQERFPAAGCGGTSRK